MCQAEAWWILQQFRGQKLCFIFAYSVLNYLFVYLRFSGLQCMDNKFNLTSLKHYFIYLNWIGMAADKSYSSPLLTYKRKKHTCIDSFFAHACGYFGETADLLGCFDGLINQFCSRHNFTDQSYTRTRESRIRFWQKQGLNIMLP